MLRGKRGFTLIELVIVLAILAILAAVAVPRFVDLSKKARRATAESELGALRAAAQLYYASTAVRGDPDWPLNKAQLRLLLDQDITQLMANTATANGTVFNWSYNGTTGRVAASGGSGWTY